MDNTTVICGKCLSYMSGPEAAPRVRWGDCGCTPLRASSSRWDRYERSKLLTTIRRYLIGLKRE